MNRPTQKIRWGIVGAGRIAQTFAQDMPATKNGVVQAVAARSGRAAQGFADKYGIPSAHEGYQALYSDPKVDAVYVATPHTFHLRNAGDALRAGKAVLCEKPITVNSKECRQLALTASEHSAYLMEAMWTWFLPAIRKAREWVDAGRIGKLVQIQADFGYPQVYDESGRSYNPELGGGCLLDMGVYPVALSTLFADREPVRVNAVSRHAPNGVEDHVVATLEYDDFVATIGTSFRTKLQNWAFVIGDAGYVAIPDFWRASECQLWVLDDMVDRFHDGRSTIGFDYQIDAVNDDLAAGKLESDTVPLAASLQFQSCMDRIRKCF
ncbi:MAG: Gfo/Idh/MocA family oxidoreductase [Pseudomonadota bacterium]